MNFTDLIMRIGAIIVVFVLMPLGVSLMASMAIDAWIDTIKKLREYRAQRRLQRDNDRATKARDKWDRARERERRAA